VLDVAVLATTLWSFTLQYSLPPALYLKAPTLFYVFVLIALRALRFDPAQVIVTGVSAAWPGRRWWRSPPSGRSRRR
jgi:adenylate cyclase